MDLSVFEIASEGVPLQLLHPQTGEPLALDDGTPMEVTVVGTDSDEWRARERAIANKRIANFGKKPVTAEELETDNLLNLVACIKSWRGMVLNGQEIPCTDEHKLALLKRLPHLRRQVDNFVGNSANFLKASRQG